MRLAYDDPVMPLTLRPFRAEDEKAAVAAHLALAAGGYTTFLLGYQPEMLWLDWLSHIERFRVGEDLPLDRVRGDFLAAEVGGELVGRVSVRFALNDWLARGRAYRLCRAPCLSAQGLRHGDASPGHGSRASGRCRSTSRRLRRGQPGFGDRDRAMWRRLGGHIAQ